MRDRVCRSLDHIIAGPWYPMRPMIMFTGLSKAFGAQTLFANVDLQLNPGCRYGLVGANGSGKSTLLRIITREEEPSSGSLNLPKRLRLGVLDQDHFRYEELPIIDVVMRGHRRLWQAIRDKERLLERAEEHFDGERYAELEDVIVSLDGYSFEARSAEILEGLGVPTAQHRMPLSTLSGGFKLRVLLAQVLASDPQCLLLDEPTNHLDIVSIRWLEKFLVGYPGCAVIVSHDQRFLDNVCTHILDVDYETITAYTGNYSRFVVAKRAERERKEAEIAKREKEIAAHSSFVERFRAKNTKARQAQSKIKQMERIVIERLPQSSRRYPAFGFRQCRPSGKDVLQLEDVEKAFGDNHVLHRVTLNVRRGDRLAIIGPNGIGKSTLLKIATGGLTADAGSVRWGYATYPGFFAQDHRDLLGERSGTAESWLAEACTDASIGFVRGQLGKVLFSGEEAEKTLSSLSGGEAARLIFARMAVERPNVMILDEPTNHLDLEAIEALVSALHQYDGTLVFVSHDRWFVSRLATRVFEITATGIRDFQGSYEEYLASCGDDHLDADTVLQRTRRGRRERDSRKDPHGAQDRAERERRKRRKELELRRDVITAAIEEAERRIEEINSGFCDPGFFDHTPEDRIRALQNEHRKLAAEVEELMARWEDVEGEIAAV